MKKTKLLTVLVCAALAFSLAACSNSSGGSSDDPQPEKKPSIPTGEDPGIGGFGGGGNGGEGNTSSATIIEFGSWPQTMNRDNTILMSHDTTTVNGWEVHTGSDEKYYVKVGDYYYKMEPIKWRVLTDNYDHDGNNATPGKKLLLADKILTGCDYFSGVLSPKDRTASDGTTPVYSNNYEYSTVRAFLNGLSFPIIYNGVNQEEDTNFVGKGFFQTAFSEEEQARIATTRVVNNAESTNPDGIPALWNNGANLYACNTTEDKIFLLSQQEVTRAAYGFEAYDKRGKDSKRLRKPTDYAVKILTGSAMNDSDKDDWGWAWDLRSPHWNTSDGIRYVSKWNDTDWDSIIGNASGVVPALCLN